MGIALHLYDIDFCWVITDKVWNINNYSVAVSTLGGGFCCSSGERLTGVGLDPAATLTYATFLKSQIHICIPYKAQA